MNFLTPEKISLEMKIILVFLVRNRGFWYIAHADSDYDIFDYFSLSFFFIF